MLYHIIGNDATRWTGQPIDGVNHPRNIGELWSKQELGAIGLVKADAQPMPTAPAGKVAVQNDEPTKVGSNWVFEWHFRDETPEESNQAREGLDYERDMRAEADFSFMADMYAPSARLSAQGAQAASAVADGAERGDYRWHGGDTDFMLADANGTLHIMDAQTVRDLSVEANAHADAIGMAAYVLGGNLPADYQDDKYWPPSEGMSAIIPAARILDANADLETQGFGARVFSSPVYTGPQATHGLMMSIGNPGLESAVAVLPDVDSGAGSNPVAVAMSLTEIAGATWGGALPTLPDEGIVKPGEMYRFDGAQYSVIQQFDRSTYGDHPDTYPAMIRYVRSPVEVEEWRQPLDQFDTYNLVNKFTGEPDRAIWQGDVYETIQDLNSHSPGGNPAGWSLVAE